MKKGQARMVIGIVLIVLQILSVLGNAKAGMTIDLRFTNASMFLYDLFGLLGYFLIGIIGLILLLSGIHSYNKLLADTITQASVPDERDIREAPAEMPNTVGFCRKCGNTLLSDAVYCEKCATTPTTIIVFTTQRTTPTTQAPRIVCWSIGCDVTVASDGDYCTKHQCVESGCEKEGEYTYTYCYEHKCAETFCYS